MKTKSILTCLALLPLLGRLAPDAAAQPLQIYILAGQSNMQGHAHVRTIPHLGMDPVTTPLLADMQHPDGTPKVCSRVWISSLGSADTVKTGPLTTGFGAAAGGPKIGPEFTFGLTMEKLIDAPILLIKTAWGGKSLHTDFRPSSACPYPFHESQLAKIRQQGKVPAAIQAEEKAAFEKLRDVALTTRERLILETGISNAQYHYLGSAKILGRLGQAPAQALAALPPTKGL